jgi:hypothetical protein
MTWAPPDLFANVTTGDLHLVDPESSPVGAAPQLSAGICESDLEGQQRDESPDFGADEFGSGVFFDGFEDGTVLWWSRLAGP